MPFAAFIVFAEGHKERYVGSLFRVDEPVPDDSKVQIPYKHNEGCNGIYYATCSLQLLLK